MTYSQIIKELKAKKYHPVYFLYGEEPYYIDAIAHFIESNVLSESERAFNQSILYGRDADPKSLIDLAFRYPMMAPYQVVILREAQEMRNLKEILPYLEKPVPTTILVICHKHKRFDVRTKFGKALKKSAVLFESKPIYDNQMPDWITRYLKKRSLNITPAAAGLVAEYVGGELTKVVNELEKLQLNLNAGTEITEVEIQEYIGISKDYNVFELQRALGQRQVVQANKIVQYFIANPRKHPMVMIVGSLYNFFSKVYMLHFLRNSPDHEILGALKLRSEWFLRDYRTALRYYHPAKTKEVLGLLKEYDLKSKGINRDGTSEGELLREMIFKILH